MRELACQRERGLALLLNSRDGGLKFKSSTTKSVPMDSAEGPKNQDRHGSRKHRSLPRGETAYFQRFEPNRRPTQDAERGEYRSLESDYRT
jgi:hypothetical protein